MKKRFFEFFLFFFSFFLVAFGQSAWFGFLGFFSSFIGYALFFRAIQSITQNKKRFFLSVIWFGLVFAIGLSWMTSIRYQGFYILFIYFVILVALGLQFGFLSLLVKTPMRISRILAIASLGCILEWSRQFVLCGFTWNPMGLALSYHYLAMQLAAFFGIYGLSFFVLLINLLGYRALFIKKTKRSILVWIFVGFFPLTFGFFHKSYQEWKNPEDNSLSILLVQTAFLPENKNPSFGTLDDLVHPFDQWIKILSTLPKKEKNFDLIVFPEHTISYGANEPIYPIYAVNKLWQKFHIDLASFPKTTAIEKPENNREVTNSFLAQGLSNYFACPIVMGLDDEDQNNHAFNAAFYFEPFTQEAKRYEKRILVPLVEYLPFKWLFPLVARFGLSHFFTHGKQAKVFGQKTPIAISICYEETFGNIMRQGRQKGAKLFVNITNDVWFPHSKLPRQHFELGRMRAIENGVPLVRACNTGVTGGVDCFGRVIKTLKNKDQSFENICESLPLQLSNKNYSTLYTYLGDFLILSICIFFLLFEGIYLLRKKNRKRE